MNAVRDLQATGRKVLFVGNGVNDAPALAGGHSGVAMGGARSDLALETADVVVVRDELAAVPVFVRLCRTARRLVAQNLVIAGTAIGMAIRAAAGQVTSMSDSRQTGAPDVPDP